MLGNGKAAFHYMHQQGKYSAYPPITLLLEKQVN